MARHSTPTPTDSYPDCWVGVNVVGIPGTDRPSAFGAVSAMLRLPALLQFWVLKRRGWV